MATEIFQRGIERNELVIILHGLSGSPEAMRGVIEASASARPDADILAPRLPFAGKLGIFSMEPAECVAGRLVKRIDRIIAEREEQNSGFYERIILVGHSFGGVLARKIAVLAHGERGAEFEPLIRCFSKPQSWAERIERIVLLAGMSRGWSPEASRNWWTAAKWTMGSWGGEILAAVSAGRWRPTIAGIRQGAPFIVQTRLQWLELTRSLNRAARARGQGTSPHDGSVSLLLVQLLGAADDLVAPDDSVDFACDQAGDRADFVLIELPFATHDDAYCMKMPQAFELRLIENAIANGNLSVLCKGERLTFQARSYLVSRAMSQSMLQLEDIRLRPEFMADSPTPQPDHLVTDVVFVIHGIRDRGFWTQKIARTIKQEAARRHPPPIFRSFTGSYGYFAMIPFVLPWIRRWKSEWLMDRYVEARALFPAAKVSYVGHSNGTYLLVRGLQDYPAARLERIVFAGSVVRRDFNWLNELAGSRVKGVLNYVATKDWVVAIFSNAFQPLKFFFDLGSAGHDGFDQFKHKNPHLHEVHYVTGEHSAALTETQWGDIARFIIDGTAPAPSNVDFALHRAWWLVMLGWLSPLLVVILVWFVLGFGIALTRSIHGAGVLRIAPSAWSLAPWNGWTCPTNAATSDLCQVLSPAGEWLLSVVNWFLDTLRGRISVPFAQQQPSNPWAVVRGACCIFYWWAVYIVATRF